MSSFTNAHTVLELELRVIFCSGTKGFPYTVPALSYERDSKETQPEISARTRRPVSGYTKVSMEPVVRFLYKRAGAAYDSPKYPNLLYHRAGAADDTSTAATTFLLLKFLSTAILSSHTTSKQAVSKNMPPHCPETHAIQ